MQRHIYFWLLGSLSLACGQDQNATRKEALASPSLTLAEACIGSLASQCQGIEAELMTSQSELDAALEDGDPELIAQLQMQTNELYEILKTYRSGRSDISEIKKRYEALQKIMASVRSTQVPPHISYRPAEIDAVRKVFEDFGDLYLASPAASEAGAPATTTIAIDQALRPWTGYWYPKSKAEIFEGPASPLSKFELYVALRGIPSTIVNWERERWKSGIYAEWEGLCDALAMAAVLTREPKSSIERNGVTFTVNDLKALAIKYYEGMQPKVYGARYEGTSRTDGEMQDLRPEAFHRMVQTIMQERKQPLVVDSDPGPEVWAKPVYSISWKVYQDPQYADALRVDAYLSMLSPRTTLPSEPLALTNYFTDTSSPKYSYRLYLDPTDKRDEKLKVVAGEWLDDALDHHPDMIFVPESQFSSQQNNKELQRLESELRNLLREAGMFP